MGGTADAVMAGALVTAAEGSCASVPGLLEPSALTSSGDASVLLLMPQLSGEMALVTQELQHIRKLTAGTLVSRGGALVESLDLVRDIAETAQRSLSAVLEGRGTVKV